MALTLDSCAARKAEAFSEPKVSHADTQMCKYIRLEMQGRDSLLLIYRRTSFRFDLFKGGDSIPRKSVLARTVECNLQSVHVGLDKNVEESMFGAECIQRLNQRFVVGYFGLFVLESFSENSRGMSNAVPSLVWLPLDLTHHREVGAYTTTTTNHHQTNSPDYLASVSRGREPGPPLQKQQCVFWRLCS